MTDTPDRITGDDRLVYVLDTSVLLSSPAALRQFDEHEVVLPLVVVKELEAKRNDPLLGYPAREALRSLEELRRIGDLRAGVSVNNVGGTVRIEVNHVDQSGLPDALAADRTHDTRILAVAANLAHDGHRVVVVSKDLPLRILAETVGLVAEEFRHELAKSDTPYTGIAEVKTSDETIDGLYAGRLMTFEAEPGEGPFMKNTGLLIQGPTKSAIGRLGKRGTVELIRDPDAFGVRGRSLEQKVALAHLLDPDIGIVSLGGRAGTGKTLLSLAAALEQTLEDRRYERILVFRPLFAVGGQELGYLPGSAEEKMGPWGAAVFDALRAFTTQDVIDEVLAQGLLEVLPLTHIRGRSFHKTFVIVDEAQNLERGVLLTALSRIGEGSKVVLSWDEAQRDNLRVGRRDGIMAVVERLAGHDLFAHTTFVRSERGRVAELVTGLLDDMVS